MQESKFPELFPFFNELNEQHFAGRLPLPQLRWNGRLRSSAGRFFPGSRLEILKRPPLIEIASYLLEEEDPFFLIRDTMGHEMIHYWLWQRRRPYGHNGEFLKKMREMGVSRYNTVPRKRPFKYLYHCPACRQQFPARRKLGALACSACCKRFSNGRYDRRFKLVLQSTLY